MSAPGSRFSAGSLQSLGRALMLPIAVLPVAGLLLRLGQPDLLDIAFVAAAGDAIFHNLGLLFAIGVAVGFARDGNGAAGLAGVVCFLVATNGAQALITVPSDTLVGLSGPSRDLAIAAFRAAALSKLSVPLGTLSGLIAGNFYNRFGAIALPDYLAFFGGRRFVPIVSGLAGLVLAGVFGRGWSVLSSGIDAASHAIVNAGPIGLFAYGLLNRLLLVTGLHHILNNVVWFIVGNYHGATGDLNRFFAGDPTAGAFMAGFFPVMIFGLPAGCLAMYHAARPERRAEVGGMLLSLALTAMLTGVTEPIEFTFMFLAPVLFAIHAGLTGAAMVLMDALHIRLGFGFSAGLLDFALNYGRATRPLWLFPIGLLYAGLYYGLFRFFIMRFNLQTPGRDVASSVQREAAVGSTRSDGYIEALGGAANLISVDACTTRLRLVVVDAGVVDDGLLKVLGARGVIRLASGRLQVVIGPIADQLAREIREAVGAGTATSDGVDRSTGGSIPGNDAAVAAWRGALGGEANLLEVNAVSSRLRVRVRDDGLVDADRLHTLGSRGLVKTGPGAWQVVLGPTAGSVAAALSA